MYKPDYRITPHLLSLIDEAGGLRALIQQASIQLSWLPVLQSEARRRGAHSSTAIEGNPLTLNQVKSIDQGMRVKTSKIFEQEVANYLKAIRWIEKNAALNINETNFLNLHKIIVKDTLSDGKCGKYKDKQNYVVNEKGIRIYTPPKPKETPKHVNALLDWLNSKEGKDLHSVLVCAIAHHRMVSIHPFSDGNGRIARALSTWILYKKDFDTQHIFSLDEFFAADRKRYYQKIQQARELDDNLTLWIEYVAEGIVSTLKDVKERMEALQISSKAKLGLSPRQEVLIRILRDKAPLSVSILQEEMSLTRARINQIIIPLIESGLVIKEGESRATRYRLS